MLIRKGHKGWDKGEGVRRWGGGLGQGGGARAWVKGVGQGLGWGVHWLKLNAYFLYHPRS